MAWESATIFSGFVIPFAPQDSLEASAPKPWAHHKELRE